MQESTYHQFVSRNLYGQTVPWPYESSGGGYVGLMQVPNAMNVAFDWIQNTQTGANIFQQKLSKAQGAVAAYQASCPGLPGLTGVQLENAAPVYYGPFAYLGPYYVPNNDCTGWSVNPNNTDGVNYAQSVRGLIQQP